MLTNTKIFCFPSQIQMASNTVFITLLSIQYGGLIVPCWVSKKLATTISISKGSWNHNFQTSRTCETNVLLKQERLNNTPLNTPPPQSTITGLQCPAMVENHNWTYGDYKLPLERKFGDSNIQIRVQQSTFCLTKKSIIYVKNVNCINWFSVVLEQDE